MYENIKKLVNCGKIITKTSFAVLNRVKLKRYRCIEVTFLRDIRASMGRGGGGGVVQLREKTVMTLRQIARACAISLLSTVQMLK